MAEIPKEVYKTLEGVEGGDKLIEGLNTWKSSINNEAKELRSQRNLTLDYLGIDHSDGVNAENLSQRLTRIQEENQLKNLENEFCIQR
mgnify:CR=1 FL=1